MLYVSCICISFDNQMHGRSHGRSPHPLPAAIPRRSAREGIFAGRLDTLRHAPWRPLWSARSAERRWPPCRPFRAMGRRFYNILICKHNK